AEGPRQADLLDTAHAAVGQGQGCVLLGGREEDLRVDPEAGRFVLPGVRRVRVPGELSEVDVRQRIVHRSPIEYPAPRAWKPGDRPNGLPRLLYIRAFRSVKRGTVRVERNEGRKS